jgi:DNA-binding response OmpR family regulator
MKSLPLVEDSRFLRTVNERAVAKAGYRNDAGEGEALAIAWVRVPDDLILLDMLLPKIGGPKVLQALRKNAVLRQFLSSC